MKKSTISFVALSLLALLCGLSSCKEVVNVSSKGQSVMLKNTNSPEVSLCLQVLQDDIVRVMKTPDGKIDQSVGPMCSYQVQQVPYDYCLMNDTLYLNTNALQVRVSTKNARVSFFDKQGQLLMQEADGGHSFTYVGKEDRQKFYSLQQTFLSPQDEAFYGLGQHQSGEMNYKAKHESLYQYNTKVSVPFIVSNKNYGILWHNYAYSKWGDPRDYLSLDTCFTLYDKNGQKGSLTASYINKKNPEDVFQRSEAALLYEDLDDMKLFPQGLRLDKCHVEWDGYLQASKDADYRFLLYYAGYVRVFIDGEEVVKERWRTAWNPNYYKFRHAMKAGEKHHLKILWQPDGGSSYLSLRALDAPENENTATTFWSQRGAQIDYYFVAGDNADQVVSGYRYLTGKAQVMPKWAMGFWQSRERYKTQHDLLAVLKEFRQRRIPIDNIVQDWSYWEEDQWGSHEFDAKRFPDPQAMVDSIHAQHAHLMISVWPKFYHNTQHYKELDAIGGMYHRAVDDSIKDWIGKGYVGSFYDAFKAEARDLFWQQMSEHLYSLGIDAWWMDASEPDILSNASMEYRQALMSPTAMGSAQRWFNAYGLMNAQGIYEGQRAENPDDRVFLLTRSCFAGSQRYGAALWSGDIGTRWEDMQAQITAGLNYSISGNPYWTMDNGGFCVERRYEKAKEGSADLEEWRELNVRWHQFGAFVPLFRSHGQYPYREIWNIAPDTHPAYAAMKYYNELRYRLLPYIYTLTSWCHFQDYTIMRPLMMDFPHDSQVLDIADQYMFGPAFMVAPVCEYQARSREVYFPEAESWYDFYTSKMYDASCYQRVAAPYHRMPLFVRAGSIVPLGNVVQHSAQAQHDIALLIYPGADAEFSLYEDDGLHYHYEKGECSNVRITYHEKDKSLHIAAREGAFAQAPNYHFKVYVMEEGMSPDALDDACADLYYEGKALDLSLDKSLDLGLDKTLNSALE